MSVMANKYMTIGSVEGNDLIIENDDYVSGYHCVIVREWTDKGIFTYVLDIGSTNGTYVNGRLAPLGMKVGISSGDEIKIGRTTLKI